MDDSKEPVAQMQDDAAFRHIISECGADGRVWFDKKFICDYVAHLKFAVVQLTKERNKKRPHGHWILEREPNGKPYCFHCSVCDDDFHYIGITSATDFCPNCGADMRRKESNQ